MHVLVHSFPKVLAIVPCHPKDDSTKTVQSIIKQQIPVQGIIITNEMVQGGNLQQKMSKILNNVLKKTDLTQYDYVLRVDADTTLPSDFLTLNLKNKPDIVGYGSAQLIKTAPFLKLMNGQLHPESDDSYIVHKFRQHNLKAYDYAVLPNKP